MWDGDSMIILGALLAVSEALSLFPKVKSNGIFQLAYNILRSIAVKLPK